MEKDIFLLHGDRDMVLIKITIQYKSMISTNATKCFKLNAISTTTTKVMKNVISLCDDQQSTSTSGIPSLVPTLE